MEQEKKILSMNDIENLAAGIYATGWRPGLCVRVYDSGEKAFVYRYKQYGKLYTRKISNFDKTITKDYLDEQIDAINEILSQGQDPKAKEMAIGQLKPHLQRVKVFLNLCQKLHKLANDAYLDLQGINDQVRAGYVQKEDLQQLLLPIKGKISEAQEVVQKLSEKRIFNLSLHDSAKAHKPDKPACEDADELSISDVFDRFITYQIQQQASHQGETEEFIEANYRPIQNNRSMFNKYILPSTGSISMRQLSIIEHISPSLIELSREHPALFEKVKGLLHKFLHWAFFSGYYKEKHYMQTLSLYVDKFSPNGGTQNNPCLDVKRIPELVEVLWNRGSNVSLAFLFSILTCSRSKAVRLSTWMEVNLENKDWVIPLDHDKSKIANRMRTIMLSDEACAVLRRLQLQPVNNEAKIFGDLNDGVFFREIQRINKERNDSQLEPFVDYKIMDEDKKPRPITQHGTARACFKTWSKEQGNHALYSELAVELCLLHHQGDAYRGAYDRATLIEERRKVMADWGRFCCSRISQQLLGKTS